MADGFQIARLIPVSGIANSTEAEMRATSALLSVLTVVRDLSVALLTPLGASAARKAVVETFIETKFKLTDGSIVRPDGLIKVSYGASTWTAIVEVKTGNNELQADQINSYLALARQQDIDAVLTISNEIGVGVRHPCEGVRIRANSTVRLAHVSWTEILAHSVRAKVHRGVNDPEQAWILSELIRYLEHPASGAMAFVDMGSNWPTVRDAVRTGTARKTSAELHDVVHRWDQLIRFVALRLGSRTGVDVQAVVPRSHSDPKIRFAHLTESLTASGTVDATIRVPGSAGDIRVIADIRARQVAASADVNAPADRGNRARVTWLLRQLSADTPTAVTIEAWPRLAREPLCATVAQAKENRDLLLDSERRDILRFRLVQHCEMGMQRKDGGRSPGFIQSVTTLVDRFYETVLQQIAPWTERPPKARPATRTVDLVESPIADPDELDEAMSRARASADESDDSLIEAPIVSAHALTDSSA